MKLAAFEYDAPTTVEEVVAILGQHDDAKILAGGQSLVPLLALRLTGFERLVDVNRIPTLQQIQRDDGWLTIGAMVRQRAAERSADVAAAAPLVARALPKIGHVQIRNRGTVGGSIAHADPAAELPAVALALDAELVAAGQHGSRTIASQDFFQSMWTTALAADELLTAVRFPVWSGRCGFAIEEFSRRTGDFAISGVACAVELDSDDRVARAGIALFGMGPTPVRAASAESGLVGETPGAADLAAVAASAAEGADAHDDIHATAAYRRRVVAHLTELAIGRALKEASGD
jgi:carbon-monoxide dehydrogenase medium subunit